jgi:hypothetical protein
MDLDISCGGTATVMMREMRENIVTNDPISDKCDKIAEKILLRRPQNRVSPTLNEA